MHQRLKERLVGSSVLVILAVIFIPMLLTGPVEPGRITETNIPARPTTKIELKLVPVDEPKAITGRPAEQAGKIIDDITSDIETAPAELETALDKAAPAEQDREEHQPVEAPIALQPLVAEQDRAEHQPVEAPAKEESAGEQPTKSGAEKTAADTTKNKQVGLPAWVVQLGSFSSKDNADRLNSNLRKSGFPAFVEPIVENNKTAYRVRVGPELLRADADALLKKIKTEMDVDGIVLNYP